MNKNLYIYEPFFDSIGVPVIYEGELYGLSHDDAKYIYEIMLKEGFYDDESDF